MGLPSHKKQNEQHILHHFLTLPAFTCTDTDIKTGDFLLNYDLPLLEVLLHLYDHQESSRVSESCGFIRDIDAVSTNLPQSSEILKIFYNHIIHVFGFLDLILNPKTGGQHLLARGIE